MPFDRRRRHPSRGRENQSAAFHLLCWWEGCHHNFCRGGRGRELISSCRQEEDEDKAHHIAMRRRRSWKRARTTRVGERTVARVGAWVGGLRLACDLLAGHTREGKAKCIVLVPQEHCPIAQRVVVAKSRA